MLMAEMKEQRKAEAGEEKCETLEEVFHRIQTVTGEGNLEKLVTKFIEGEHYFFCANKRFQCVMLQLIVCFFYS